MTLFSFIGCALTAYGPPAALFTITIASDPIKIIILILSAFFWLLSVYSCPQYCGKLSEASR